MEATRLEGISPEYREKPPEYEGLDFSGIRVEGLVDEGETSYFLLEEQLKKDAVGNQSILYVCRRCTKENEAAGTEKFIAKVYYNCVNIDDNAQMKIRRFLHSPEARQNHILPQVNHGYINKSFYCEIYPFCPDGDLSRARYSYEELLAEVLPQLNAALRTIAQAGIVHRDIKPANIYRTGKELFVADFGIATLSDNAYTVRARGTPTYTAPEIALGFTSEKTDYYSLGVTLCDLYKGEPLFKEMSDAEALRCISRRELPLSFAPGHEPLKRLIESLLQYEDKRSGFQQVEEFLRSPKDFVPVIDAGASQINYVFAGTHYRTCDSLSQGLVSKWDEAKNHLFTRTLKTYFDQVQMDIGASAGRVVDDADKAIRQVEANESLSAAEKERLTSLLEDAALMYFLRTLSASYWLGWRGRKYNGLCDIADRLLEGDSDAAALFDRQILQQWVGAFVGRDTEERAALAKAVLLSSLNDACAKKLFILSFSSRAEDRELTWDGRRFPTMDSLFEALTRNAQTFYSNYEALMVSGDFVAFFCRALPLESLGATYAEATDAQLTKKDRFRLLLKIFEATVSRPSDVRSFYLNYGDNADAVWVIRNLLKLYAFEGEKAGALFRKIQGLRLPDPREEDLASLCRALDGFHAVVEELRRLLKDNFFLSYIGQSGGASEDGVFARTSGAFFVYEFWDRPAPASLLHHMNVKQS